MYIRTSKIKNKNTNTVYINHLLVESVRTDNGPRQRVVMNIGRLDGLTKKELRELAKILEARVNGVDNLISESDKVHALAQQIVEENEIALQSRLKKTVQAQETDYKLININKASFSATRSLGAELVAHTFWQRLQFENILREKCKFSDRQIAAAYAMIIGKLIHPGSEHATINWIKNSSSLPEFVKGLADINVAGKNQFYDIGDELFAHKEDIEYELRRNATGLFDLPETVCLFDITNTYFEGSCRGNKLAQFGRSKEKRSDCKLVSLGLVVNENGFPIYSQIYEGNKSEPQAFVDVLTDITKHCKDVNKPIVVMDRGIATKDNIALLATEGYQYTVIERSPVEKRYLEVFATAKETFERLEGRDVYVKKIEESGDTVKVLAFSESRKQKENSMDTLKEKRFLEDIKRLDSSTKKRTIIKSEIIHERIGRLKAKYATITKYYSITISKTDDGQKATAVSAIKKTERKHRETLTGCYVIESTQTNLSAKEIWEQYMTLVRVEGAFRDLKTELGLRPVYHQKEERTKAHIFITILAYHLLASIEHSLKQTGDTRDWNTIKDVLQTHMRATIKLHEKNGIVHQIRLNGEPEPVHQIIYKSLNIKNPLKAVHTKLSTVCSD